MAKFKNKAEAKEALATAKEERKAAFAELRAFEKENSLAKGEDHSASKVGKKWAKLKAAYDKKVTASDAIEEAMKGLKSEPTVRPSKYTYPADCVTAADKKKFRAAARAAAKKGDKPAKAEKTDKKAKGKKEEKAAAAAPAKGKKAKKEEAVED